MKITSLVVLITLLSTIPAVCSTFKLENGYTSLSGKDGVVTSLRFDPSGKGQYGKNHIISFTVGIPVETPDCKTEIDPSVPKIILKGVRASNPLKIERDEANHPAQLKEGETLSQMFKLERGFIQSAAGKFPTWGTDDSSFTLTLYRLESGSKVKVASRRVENHQDNSWAELTFPDQPAGDYLLEVSDVKGIIGWWSYGDDRCIRITGCDVITGDWEISLEGNKLKSELKSEERDSKLNHVLVTPWIKSGYDTTSDRIIFSHFITSSGLYKPVHQFKRRPVSHVSGEWVLMSGRFGTDIKFLNAPISLEMAEDSMTMLFPGTTRELEVLPHTTELSEHFPEFFSSNSEFDKVLNQFLLSHNFNFGAGTNSDWKEWHTLCLSWTANPQEDWQRSHFLAYKMEPSGYVYCWGDSPGWPFPYKDDDKDGNNDYDTRHFTSNPCFVIGAWREYCWNPEPEYLAKIMPRVRHAVEFMLKECEGEKGLYINNGVGHEGKDGGIGSNYWDILPFGHKSAFENAHFYLSLEAMAQLEEAALSNAECRVRNAESPVTVRTPRYYRRLVETVRKNFNDTFWLEDKGRYSGCVDIDGVVHDYGFTFVNLPAMAYGLADPDQVKRIYDWMENGITASGKADTYSRWIFAPRSATIHNPKRDEPQSPKPSWWCMVWNGTDYDEQCQAGGAILYTSYYDIMARAKYLGGENAWKRFSEILDRYNKPDHLSGGSPLYYGETTQGGPGGTAGSVGVEGEFPESGLVPVSFLYAFMGVDADIHGLKIRPNLPKALDYAGVKKLRFNGKMYDIRVTNSEVEVKCTTKGHERTIKQKLAPGEVFRVKGD